MVSPVIRFAENFNRPFLHFVVKKGWYIRLKSKKLNGKKFRKLDKKTKKEIKDYWKQYGKNVSTDWVSYFSANSDIVDIKVIPESLYYGEILKKINDQKMGTGLSDKNMYDLIFDAKQPETVFRKSNGILLNKNFEPITDDELIKICSEFEQIILKPTNGTYGGSGILFWNYTDGVQVLNEYLLKHKDIIAQDIVKQHSFFSDIHPASLNTLRIVTMLIDNEVVLLSTLLRMGRNNSKVDNYSAGGIICPVDKEGILFDKAVQSDGSILTKHPDGFVFSGKQVPNFENILNEAKRMHYVIPYFKMISWDFTLGEDGKPILIEGNYPAGQLDFHQFNIGSIFGEYTDIVLDMVYKNS